MAASGKRFNKKSKISGQVAEVIPPELVNMIPTGVTGIIYDSSFDPSDADDTGESVWLKQPATLHKFFGTSSSRKQILALVEHAGPLDQLESYIRQAYAKNESDLQATLMIAIAMAAKGLDFTLRNQEDIEIDKGVVERLLELHAELFPHDQAKALQQAQEATVLSKDKYLAVLEKIIVGQQISFDEEEKAETTRISMNDAALKQLSDAFTQNNEKTLTQVIDNFKTFLNTQQESLKNNPGLYYANLMHLMNGVKALPDQWNGNNADRFYGEILGVIRESVNRAAIKQVSDAYVTGKQKKIDKALEAFKQFNKQNEFFSINEQGYPTNNLLNVNHIHLIYCAYDELSRRDGELPGSSYGENADLFCINIIGGLQRCLPPRVRQTLSYKDEQGYTHGLYHVLEENKKVTRSVDPSGEKYLGRANSNGELGVNSFYGIFGGPVGRVHADGAGPVGGRSTFQDLLQAITTATNHYTTIPVCLSQTVSVFDNVETSSSPAEKRL